MARGGTGEETVERLLQESPVFGALDADARAMLSRELEPRRVSPGEVVIRQGDTADGLYLVASGRVQAILTRDDGSRVVLGEDGRGDITGEMALVNDVPRTATVVALRESHLLFLSTDAFERFVGAHPHALRAITTALIRKLSATIRRGPTTSPATSIAIVPLDDDARAGELGRRLATSLERLVGPVRVVGEADVRVELGDAPTDLAQAMWFERLEATHGAVVYVTDPTEGPWTDRCVRHADLVLLAASGRASPTLRLVEHELHQRQGLASRRTELILVHEPATVVPRHTERWLAPRTVDRHHHIRVDRAADYDRVARLLVGQGIGVVFGGGGARGIAHIGVLQALADHGVPIDAVGGTSIGSIVAGAVARGLTLDELATMLRAAVVDGRSPVDLTFPAVSLAAGARVTERIRRGADGLDLEDGWLSCFCVSTNLTRATLELHTRGPAWKAIRASFSVPGIFPPVPNDAGEILVDGGLLDNLPVGSMRAAHAGITVIGIDVGAAREPLSAPLPPTGVVSGWGYLWSNLKARTPGNLASLPRLLVRLTELGSNADEDRGDCYLRPGTDAVSLLDFDAFDELVEIGRRDAAPALAEWLASPDAPSF